jgi:hypothetical protein
MKPICIPHIFMKILNLLTIIDKKHPLYVFLYLKLQNLEIVGLFIPQGL